ncbi:MAG: oxidoreductase [Alishewanella sp. 32-51-5]|nr:MAG: oxidoreductase [Alishewanella sp. 32-51-5]
MKKSLSFSLLAATLSLALSSASAQDINTEKAKLTLDKVASGLEHPWGLAFLPDGRMLVTERPGRIRYINQDGSLSEPLTGLPAVEVAGQGGLLDVLLHPDFAQNQQIFISYNEPGAGGSSTAVARATLRDNTLTDVTVIFSAAPKFQSRHHFGGRLVITDDRHLFITLGDRGQRRQDAQTFDNHHGKVVRLNLDGSVPADNPYVKDDKVLDDIWSYGHRNIQGHYWVPSIAPSGMTFYLDDAIPGWQNNLLVGSLRFGQLVRLELDGEKVSHEERIMIGQRIRDVRQGPDGAVYLLTDQADGQLLRLRAASN